MNSLAQVVRSCPWLVAIGAVDPYVLGLAASAPRSLLVVPDRARLDPALPMDVCGNLELREQLVGASSQAVSWYVYNDSRRDGLQEPEALRAFYPNLRLERLELRQQISLLDLLQSWEPAGAAGGALFAVGALGLAALMGAGAELRRVDDLVLVGIDRLSDSDLLDLDQRCKDHHLVRVDPAPDTSVAFRWTADRHRRLEEGLLRERDELAAQRDGLLGERDAIAAERERVTLERDELAAQRDGLLGERDAIAAERDRVALERDELAAQRDGLLGERDAIAAERDRVAAERDELAAQRDGLLGEREAIAAERDRVAAERDELAAQRDGLLGERDAIAAERERVTLERDELAAQRDGLLGERDAIAAERDRMHERLEAINCELDEILALMDQVTVEASGEQLDEQDLPPQ